MLSRKLTISKFLTVKVIKREFNLKQKSYRTEHKSDISN